MTNKLLKKPVWSYSFTFFGYCEVRKDYKFYATFRSFTEAREFLAGQV